MMPKLQMRKLIMIPSSAQSPYNQLVAFEPRQWGSYQLMYFEVLFCMVSQYLNSKSCRVCQLICQPQAHAGFCPTVFSSRSATFLSRSSLLQDSYTWRRSRPSEIRQLYCSSHTCMAFYLKGCVQQNKILIRSSGENLPELLPFVNSLFLLGVP